MKRRRAMCLFALGLAALSPAATRAAAAPTGLQRDVVFTAHAPLARNDVLLHRLLSPLNALRIEQQIPRGAGTLRAWPLDPAQQHFALYVPATLPPDGYALLVFVPPWKQARVPLQWIPALDRSRTIFVSAAASGNDANVMERREPLALLAAFNVMRRYHVDPTRVYVGGFSGGSRVALRLALAFPDLFHGALLDAGSDPIGDAAIPLPPAGLFQQFQQSSRMVFLTGDRDEVRQMQLADASASLEKWCVFDVDSITIPFVGHELADGGYFTRALDALAQRSVPDPAKLAACRARITRGKNSRLQQVQAWADAGKTDAARKLLDQTDAQFGGFAAPDSVRLAHELGMH
ncbi:MAG: hypothetical protein EPN36_16355 [Rhodanobacteraceae bacterium]|nr:MAG: hypothetical protein EPN36_16355 [Rhodanobacteraceae bacterium]